MSTPTITITVRKDWNLLERFQACKALAIGYAEKGDRESARFWGQQAREDWRILTTPAL